MSAQNRILGNTSDYEASDYVDRATITEELTYARQICTRHGWPMIDVSRRSIEEDGGRDRCPARARRA